VDSHNLNEEIEPRKTPSPGKGNRRTRKATAVHNLGIRLPKELHHHDPRRYPRGPEIETSPSSSTGRFLLGDVMGKVIADMSMSLDGFSTGPNDGPDNPLGEGGDRLHEWMAGLGDWGERHDLTGPHTEVFRASRTHGG
jgi:hypothetical protein